MPCCAPALVPVPLGPPSRHPAPPSSLTAASIAPLAVTQETGDSQRPWRVGVHCQPPHRRDERPRVSSLGPPCKPAEAYTVCTRPHATPRASWRHSPPSSSPPRAGRSGHDHQTPSLDACPVHPLADVDWRRCPRRPHKQSPWTWRSCPFCPLANAFCLTSRPVSPRARPVSHMSLRWALCVCFLLFHLIPPFAVHVHFPRLMYPWPRLSWCPAGHYFRLLALCPHKGESKKPLQDECSVRR